MKHILNFFQRLLASVMFLGYIPFISGTVGSAAAVFGLWWITYKMHFTLTYQTMWLAGIALTAFSILISSRPREVFGSDDPKQVVIDEVAGQFITFLFIPLTLKTLLLGFFLFRFFDIVKPYPVNKFESLDGGVGITMDDIIAGILSNVVLMGIVYGYHMVHGLLQ